jgi:hypothetical protein
VPVRSSKPRETRRTIDHFSVSRKCAASDADVCVNQFLAIGGFGKSWPGVRFCQLGEILQDFAPIDRKCRLVSSPICKRNGLASRGSGQAIFYCFSRSSSTNSPSRFPRLASQLAAIYGYAVYGQMAGTDIPVPIQQSPTEASSVTLLAYDCADPLMQAAIRRVTFCVGIGPGLLSLRIALHALDPVNEVCGAEPLAHPYL